jgi:hypothetical protein
MKTFVPMNKQIYMTTKASKVHSGAMTVCSPVPCMYVCMNICVHLYVIVCACAHGYSYAYLHFYGYVFEYHVSVHVFCTYGALYHEICIFACVSVRSLEA